MGTSSPTGRFTKPGRARTAPTRRRAGGLWFESRSDSDLSLSNQWVQALRAVLPVAIGKGSRLNSFIAKTVFVGLTEDSRCFSRDVERQLAMTISGFLDSTGPDPKRATFNARSVILRGAAFGGLLSANAAAWCRYCCLAYFGSWAHRADTSCPISSKCRSVAPLRTLVTYGSFRWWEPGFGWNK